VEDGNFDRMSSYFKLVSYVFFLVVSIAKMTPSNASAMHLSSVPRGLGFRRTNERCGRLQVAVVQGRKVLVDSSRI